MIHKSAPLSPSLNSVLVRRSLKLSGPSVAEVCVLQEDEKNELAQKFDFND